MLAANNGVRIVGAQGRGNQLATLQVQSKNDMIDNHEYEANQDNENSHPIRNNSASIDTQEDYKEMGSMGSEILDQKTPKTNFKLKNKKTSENEAESQNESLEKIDNNSYEEGDSQELTLDENGAGIDRKENKKGSGGEVLVDDNEAYDDDEYEVDDA